MTYLQHIFSTTPERYSPLLRSLHWVIAAMILAALTMSAFVMSHEAYGSPQRAASLLRHVSTGALVFLASLIRVFVRRGRPTPLSSGMVWADSLATFTHRLLEVLVFLMVASGVGIVIQADLAPVLLTAHATLPANLAQLPLRTLHVATACLLAAALALHICGALYHQFILRDGLIARMGFGQARADAPQDGEPAAL